jgi:hypothetical protein
MTWSRVLLEKLIVTQLIKKFLAFFWKPKFRHRVHKSPSWAKCIQSTTSHTIYLRSILMLSYHLRLGLRSGFFPSWLPAKIFYAFLISPIRGTCPAHHSLLDLIMLIIFGEAHKLFSSSLYSLLQPLTTFSLLGPNALLNTLFTLVFKF